MKLTSSIYVGEESGRLETMLTNLADDFDFEAEQASERMVTLIQPIMIIFLAVVICLIIISVLLPIYTLYNNEGRHRVNIYFQQEHITAAIRIINNKIKSLEE